MTRDDIISMARGADPFGDAGRLFAMAEITPETLERFAALVAAAERTAMARHFDVSLRNAVKAEREACAVAAWAAGMAFHNREYGTKCDAREVGSAAAEAIRARARL